MASKKLKLGIIGISEGNGHPYSWAAIFNGYDETFMKDCPFPVIPEYLSKQQYPTDFLCNAVVSHIWTQSRDLSENIAKASNIEFVADSIEEMTEHVDAVLLARDDAENHFEFARPVLQAGLPIYIDKPFALSVTEANNLWGMCKYDNQIFTCSALQFANEFSQSKLNLDIIGDPKFVIASVPKSWDKYAVHIIEPLFRMFPNRGELISAVSCSVTEQIKTVQVLWGSGLTAHFNTTGSIAAPLSYRVIGTKGYQDLIFKDSFGAFKNALNRFIEFVNKDNININRSFTLEMVRILEIGRNA